MGRQRPLAVALQPRFRISHAKWGNKGMTQPKVENYIQGEWRSSVASDSMAVVNPATGEVLTRTPLSTSREVDDAVQAAAKAFPEWRRTPVGTRIQYLFGLKELLEDNFEELARTVTMESGKTLAESRGEMRRAIENVEVACGMPTLIQGYNPEDVASGIDEMMIRQPLGVCAIIAPFNFPAMIPFWFLPYAMACGNTFILKPSERVPLTMQRMFALIEQLKLPAGVVNMVNGGNHVVDALLDHPELRAISFVGSSAGGELRLWQCAAHGKRAQCAGGAKNHVLVLDDADIVLHRTSLRTALSAARGSAAWPFRWRSQWATRGRLLKMRSGAGATPSRSATDSMKSCPWAR